MASCLIVRRRFVPSSSILLRWCSAGNDNDSSDAKSKFQAEMSKSNANFPSFTTVGKTAVDFQSMTKSPGIVSIASTIISGDPDQHSRKYVDPSEVLTGAKMAIETVTSYLAGNISDPENSPLPEQLTPKCFRELLTVVANDGRFDDTQKRGLLATNADDIFFSWIDRAAMADSGKLSLRVCAMALPHYNAIKEIIADDRARTKEFESELKSRLQSGSINVNEAQREAADFNSTLLKPMQYLKSNEFVVSNWDFTQGEQNEWLIDGIAMRKGSESYLGPFYYRWKFRMASSIVRNKTFLSILRFDYMTDWLVLILLTHMYALSTVTPTA